MSANDILTLILAFIGFSILLYAAIRMGKDSFSEDLK